jgi:hypothetical protein
MEVLVLGRSTRVAHELGRAADCERSIRIDGRLVVANPAKTG